MEVGKIYAIIETGGKQYKVTPGQTLEVERLKVASGEAIALDKVLLVDDGKKVTVGNPLVTGAKVMATSQGEAKDDKIIVFKYKPKMRYRKKTGHRQIHTLLTIDKIVGPKAARAKKAASKEEETV